MFWKMLSNILDVVVKCPQHKDNLVYFVIEEGKK